MGARENSLKARILLRWGAHPKVCIWRANSGQAWVPIGRGRFRPIDVNIDGCPDIIGFVEHVPHALFLGIEVKSENDVIRKTQEIFRARLESNRGLYVLAYSVDDVDQVLVPLVGPPPAGAPRGASR